MSANTGRPSTITEEDIARWRKSLDEYIKTEEANRWSVQLLLSGDRGFAVWCCGEWLGEQIDKYGGDDAEVRSVCFANGQRLAFCADEKLWETTEASLKKFLIGIPDVPGSELAEQIINESLNG